jgi:hypothetical protein
MFTSVYGGGGVIGPKRSLIGNVGFYSVVAVVMSFCCCCRCKTYSSNRLGSTCISAGFVGAALMYGGMVRLGVVAGVPVVSGVCDTALSPWCVI